jgi:hypothetical protein
MHHNIIKAIYDKSIASHIVLNEGKQKPFTLKSEMRQVLHSLYSYSIYC